MPEALVVTVTELTSVEVLKLARVAPVVIDNDTAVLYAGIPPAPMTVTLTVAGLRILIESGFTVIEALIGVGGVGVPICTCA